MTEQRRMLMVRTGRSVVDRRGTTYARPGDLMDPEDPIVAELVKRQPASVESVFVDPPKPKAKLKAKQEAAPEAD